MKDIMKIIDISKLEKSLTRFKKWSNILKLNLIKLSKIFTY